MAKMKFSSLVFVSRSLNKYKEYKTLMNMPDLKLSQIHVTEPQSMNLEFLVEEKIKVIRPQLPDAPFFVEHTGLIIDAWKGLPGGLTDVFMDTVGNDGICKMMSSYKGDDRAARAKVVIGYYHQSSGIQTFAGEVTGTIVNQPRGTNNFGWDPIFIPDGDTRTYAEMSQPDKNRTSMRRVVVDIFMPYLLQHFEI
jgi:non-canonical purine NTP pyrophosphatase (RdgB/HAM1 family)